MCTILLAWRCVPDAPLVLAANRDELRGRPSEGPQVLARHPTVAGGRDVLAGGTWLAVAADGRVAAVTNRRSEGRDPTRRSRGDLPLQALAAGDAAAMRRLVAGLSAAAYNPCNVLVADTVGAAAGRLDGEGAVRVVDLQPGPHVLTVDDVDDRARTKVAALSDMLEAAVGVGDADAVLAAMEEVLRDHGGPGRDGVDAACIHGDLYGTVSSSSVAVHAGGRIVYRHAPGQPCVTPHEDVSALLRP